MCAVAIRAGCGRRAPEMAASRIAPSGRHRESGFRAARGLASPLPDPSVGLAIGLREIPYLLCSVALWKGAIT